MDEITLKNNVAANLTRYRKALGMTQAELAQKINYSDKSISKWERGDGIPDAFVLCEIAELFGITVNELVYDGADPALENSTFSAKAIRKGEQKRHAVMTMLSCGIVWLAAVVIFVLMLMLAPQAQASKAWLAFIFAIPICSIICLVFSKLWFGAPQTFCSVSALAWSLALTAHLSVTQLALHPIDNAYLLYIVAGAFQVLVVLWYILKRYNALNAIFKRK